MCGHLVTVNSAAENAFLVDTFVLNGHQTDPLWIGLNDAASEGNFVWTSGQPVTYTNWYQFEPNNDLRTEDWATLNWLVAVGESTNHGAWNDVQFGGTTTHAGTTNGPYFGIVEVVPEPTIASAFAIAALSCRRRRRH